MNTIAISCFSETENPLAKFSKQWTDLKYLASNTEKNSPFLSERGKEVIYVLNLARSNPSLYLATVIKRFPGLSGRPNLVNSLGQRKLLFEDFSKIGVSIQPHTTYGCNIVIDFGN